ncbi:flagellar protein FliT [Amphibacillus sp. Q70]|uniref:flagellar protein FliT n=1 Tax=Amphibacillus sp. Q70 TaxID=3453416 RepID=UPI003F868040
MSVLNELKKVTEGLAQVIEQPVTAKNRDQVLEQIDEYLDKRSQLLENVKAPFSEVETELGTLIMEKDKEIQLKLNHLFLALKGELRDVKKQKVSTEKYLAPYRNVASNDGSYWDKKK